MMRTCRSEPYVTAKAAVETLMVTQHGETGDPALPLDPAWAMYEVMARTGRFVCLILREDERPIGYAIGMVHPHINSKAILVATVPTWYVEPMQGRPWVEKALLHEIECRLVALGATRVTVETHADKSAARLLEVMHHKATKIAYTIDADQILGKANRQEA